MHKQAFTVTHNNNSYSIAKRKLPWRGQHGDATDVVLRDSNKWGQYIAFYVTCNNKSPEPGRCYCVHYYINDGEVSYFTVN